MRCTRILAAIAVAFAACNATTANGSGAATTAAGQTGNALDALVHDVCKKDIVLLGEDANHGSGRTFAVKTQLVRRLVEQCHFDAVVFESQVYDFIDLQHAFDRKTATAEQVGAAIGGLWSKASASKPLVDYLFRQARTGRVTLAGIDPQIGGATQLYTQQQLPAVLARHLAGSSRTACEAELARLTNWQYDDTTRYDDATRTRLRACLTEIRAAITEQSASREMLEAEHMASNLLRYLDMASGNEFDVRDRAMFDNLEWQIARLPKGTKVLVWCASVHAAKAAMPDTEGTPMGRYIHDAYSDRAAAIGFSARSGSFGRPGKTPTVLDTTAQESLESRVFASDGNTDDFRYVDQAKLARFGAITARALNYRQPQAANWATLLDGVVVLREEQPLP